jgi:hypothetical protein
MSLSNSKHFPMNSSTNYTANCEALVNEYGGAVSNTHHAVRIELENRKRQSRKNV